MQTGKKISRRNEATNLEKTSKLKLAFKSFPNIHECTTDVTNGFFF